MNPESNTVLLLVAKQLDISCAQEQTALKSIIINAVRHLIHTDFQKLVNILYRMDVSETRLRKMLEDNPGLDAGNIITELIIERQMQALKTRGQFNQRDKNINPDGAW